MANIYADDVKPMPYNCVLIGCSHAHKGVCVPHRCTRQCGRVAKYWFREEWYCGECFLEATDGLA